MTDFFLTVLVVGGLAGVVYFIRKMDRHVHTGDSEKVARMLAEAEILRLKHEEEQKKSQEQAIFNQK